MKWSAAIAGTAAALLCINGFANAHIGISYYETKNGKSDAGLRIVHISDFHNDKKHKDELIRITKDQNPDIIVITGDFIDSRSTDIPLAISAAEGLAKIAPVYYVTGNHEARLPECESIKARLRDAGVSVLEGSGVEIKEGIMLYGIDDPESHRNLDADSTGNVEFMLQSVDTDDSKFNILLSHRPEAFTAYRDYDLVLTGHAHGGQLRIPFIGGVIAPDQGLFPEFDAGMFKEGKTTMIVSRGIGNSLFPLRINDPPELVVVDVKA